MTVNCFRVFCKIVGLSEEPTTNLILMLLLMPEAEREREEAAIEAWFREHGYIRD
jgi:hypothetical protein